MPALSSLPSLLLAVAVTLAALARPAGAFTPEQATAPMTVTLVRSDSVACGAACPEWLALTGKIVPGTAALLDAALRKLGRRSLPLLIDSPGGSVEAGLAMRRAIRARHLDVAVSGTGLSDCASTDAACHARLAAGEHAGFIAGSVAACASSCVLVLAAGTNRVVTPGSAVGVHQMIVHKTFTKTLNTFRIIRKMVDGRPVEVSRSLVASRALSSSTVQTAATEDMYSTVDRYMLGMGVAESIMPLMRSAAPTEVHWMTPAELVETRIETETTDARTLVARAFAPRITAPPAAAAPVAVAVAPVAPLHAADPKAQPPVQATAVGPTPAVLTVGDGNSGGTVAWRVDEGRAPTLVGEIEVPARHLHGTLSIARAAPGAAADLVVALRFTGHADADGARVARLMAPKFCGAGRCDRPAAVGPRDRDAGDDASFEVAHADAPALLAALRERDWLAFTAAMGDGARGEITLSLAGAARAAVTEWERRCCGLAAPALAQGTAAPPR